jgi:hypothetical protein
MIIRNEVIRVQKSDSKSILMDASQPGRLNEFNYPFITGIQLCVHPDRFELGNAIATKTLKRIERKLAR